MWQSHRGPYKVLVSSNTVTLLLEIYPTEILLEKEKSMSCKRGFQNAASNPS